MAPPGLLPPSDTPFAGTVFAIEEFSRSFEEKTNGTVITTVIAARLALGGVFARILIAFGRGMPGRTGVFMREYPVMFAALCGLVLALVGLSSGTGYGEGSVPACCASRAWMARRW